MDDAGWIDRFIRHLEIERRLSPLTAKNYRRDLELLLRYADDAGIEDWRNVDSEHIRAFAAAGFRKGISARSIQRRLSAARTFFRYLLREKHVRRNPVQSVSAPRGAKRLPENLDADRMARHHPSLARSSSRLCSVAATGSCPPGSSEQGCSLVSCSS